MLWRNILWCIILHIAIILNALVVILMMFGIMNFSFIWSWMYIYFFYFKNTKNCGKILIFLGIYFHTTLEIV